MLTAESYVIRTLPHWKSHLRRDNPIFSILLLQPSSDNFLRESERIDVGGIDKITTLLCESIHHCAALFFGCFILATKSHRAETQLTYPEPGPAQKTVVHSKGFFSLPSGIQNIQQARTAPRATCITTPLPGQLAQRDLFLPVNLALVIPLNTLLFCSDRQQGWNRRGKRHRLSQDREARSRSRNHRRSPHRSRADGSCDRQSVRLFCRGSQSPCRFEPNRRLRGLIVGETAPTL